MKRTSLVEDIAIDSKERTEIFNDDDLPEKSNDEILRNSTQQISFTKTMEPSDVIKTLPDGFKSMINESIEVENDNAEEVIKMLGEKLGINDYTTNMSTFWLLDTIALEVVRLKHDINPKNLAVLVSWLAGEAKLIQENRYSREEFFREMNRIFAMIYNQLGEGRSLIYWEEIISKESIGERKKNETREADDEKDAASDTISEFSMDKEAEYEIEKEIVSTASDEIAETWRNSSKNESPNYDQLVPDNPTDVLEAIIESTYRIYANAFHYATISAAFTQPIKLIPYNLPYTLRFPKPIEQFVAKPVAKEVPKKGAGLKTKKGRSGPDLSQEISPPSRSTTDEEIAAQKPKYILPLMESNEAPLLIEYYSNLRTKNIDAAAKDDKKKKRNK